jgi:hypothetical protein
VAGWEAWLLLSAENSLFVKKTKPFSQEQSWPSLAQRYGSEFLEHL